MSDSTKAVAAAGTQATTRSFPYLSILSLVLVIAKLAGHFPHSWWLVFLPVYGIPVAFIAGLLTLLALGGIVFGVLFVIAAIIDAKNKK